MDLWIACELVQASVTMVHILRAAGLLTASFTEAENQIVSLEQTSEDYLINDGFESDVIVGMIESEMIKTLTYRQKVVYDACIRKGIPMSEFAVENGVSKQSVQHALKFIRKKSKKYLK